MSGGSRFLIQVVGGYSASAWLLGSKLSGAFSTFHRRWPAKRCGMTALIAVPPSGIDFGSVVFQRQDPVGVKVLVAQAAVQRPLRTHWGLSGFWCVGGRLNITPPWP